MPRNGTSYYENMRRYQVSPFRGFSRLKPSARKGRCPRESAWEVASQGTRVWQEPTACQLSSASSPYPAVGLLAGDTSHLSTVEPTTQNGVQLERALAS